MRTDKHSLPYPALKTKELELSYDTVIEGLQEHLTHYTILVSDFNAKTHEQDESETSIGKHRYVKEINEEEG